MLQIPKKGPDYFLEIFGPVFDLTAGPVLGLIVGPVFDLTAGPVFGLMVGPVFGLITTTFCTIGRSDRKTCSTYRNRIYDQAIHLFP